jgi:ribosomal protein L11 methyltransferase
MLRLAVRVRRADAELVLAELLELAPGGVEEVDIDTGTVEYAVYGAPGELPQLPDLRAAAGGALVDVVTTEVADDWADRWRQFHKPLVLGDRLSVRPPWEPPQETALDLVIDPGRAFGTGAHPTTRLSLELLLDIPIPAERGSVLDLGCGSGVLGIAAAKLGWSPVLALDYDQLAVDATLENARVNRVADRLEVRHFDLLREPVPPAPLVLANLLGPLLVAWTAQMAGRVHRSIIASGLLETEALWVAESFAEHGYRESRRLISGEWAALLIEAPDRG